MAATKPPDDARTARQEADALGSLGGPAVNPLPHAPTGWSGTGGRAVVDPSTDPARPHGEVGNADALGAVSELEQVATAQGRDAPKPDPLPTGNAAGVSAPLQQTGAADATGHREPDRDRGLTGGLPGSSDRTG